MNSLRLFSLIPAFVVALWGASAGAQGIAPDCPPRPADPTMQKKLADEWFSKAESLFAEKRYNWALEGFMCSLKMVEHPVTTYNAAQAANFSGEKQVALDLAKRSLKQDPEGESAAVAKELIVELVIELDAEKPDPETHTCTKEDGEWGKVRLLKVIGFSAIVLGGAAAVTGITLQAVTGSLQSDSEQTDDPEVFQDKRNTGGKFQKGAIAGFVVGGIALGAGLTIILVDNKRRRKDETKVALVPGPGTLILSGRF